MLHPACGPRGAGAGDQAFLQGTVLPLDHPITLGVVGGCQLVRDAKTLGQLGPQLRRELAATVSNDGLRDSKTRHPVAKESLGTGLGSDVRHRIGLQPPSITVDDRQQVRVALGLG